MLESKNKLLNISEVADLLGLKNIKTNKPLTIHFKILGN